MYHENRIIDAIISLKMTARQFERQSAASARLDTRERANVKKSLERGACDVAAVHASSAIRHKNESLNFLRLASRLDGMTSRLETQMKMRGAQHAIASIVKNLERALNTESIEKMHNTFDTFEKQCDNLQIQSDAMETAMGGVTQSTTPPHEVDDLISQIAHENNIEIRAGLPGTPATLLLHTEAPQGKEDAMLERFERFKTA